MQTKFHWPTLIVLVLVCCSLLYFLDANSKNPRNLTGTQTIRHNDSVYVVQTTILSVRYKPSQINYAEPDPR